MNEWNSAALSGGSPSPYVATTNTMRGSFEKVSYTKVNKQRRILTRKDEDRLALFSVDDVGGEAIGLCLLCKTLGEVFGRPRLRIVNNFHRFPIFLLFLLQLSERVSDLGIERKNDEC